MVVCHVWDAEYPWDVRVEKISRSLTDWGHQVHIVARNRDARPPLERLAEGTVHRMPYWPLAGPRINELLMFPAPVNPRWILRIDRTVRTTGADVILCRDLPLAPAALCVGRRRRTPVVLDMAENYPAMIQKLWTNGEQRPFDWVVRNPAIVRAVERSVIPRVDHILVVVEESRDRLRGLGVPGGRITVVSNTPKVTTIANSSPRPSAADRPLRVVYLGMLDTRARGVEVLLRGVAESHRNGVPISLSILGDGRGRPWLERRAAELGLLDGGVVFRGWVPNAQAQLELLEHDVGVVPHPSDEHVDTTIPNKLFDYMAAGLAVLTANAPPLERIVRETGCGEVYDGEDPSDLCRAIRALRDDRFRRRCGQAGQQAIAETYHWERDAERLEKALLDVTGRNTQAVARDADLR